MATRMVLMVVTAAALAAGASFASNLGSVVNSWNASYVDPQYYYSPIGVDYGGGYVWVSYSYVYTQRVPKTGSIVSSIYPANFHGNDMGYEDATGYLYLATGNTFVAVRESLTGSLVRTFGVPPGVAFTLAIEFDDGAPSAPVWLGDATAWRLWNLTSTGSLLRSLNTTFSGVRGLAYDRDTSGGPYLFVGVSDGPSVIYALKPDNGSVLYSFPAPVSDNSLAGLAWDGSYLWAADNTKSWVFQFVAHDTGLTVLPRSLGRVKALYY